MLESHTGRINHTAGRFWVALGSAVSLIAVQLVLIGVAQAGGGNTSPGQPPMLGRGNEQGNGQPAQGSGAPVAEGGSRGEEESDSDEQGGHSEVAGSAPHGAAEPPPPGASQPAPELPEVAKTNLATHTLRRTRSTTASHHGWAPNQAGRYQLRPEALDWVGDDERSSHAVVGPDLYLLGPDGEARVNKPTVPLDRQAQTPIKPTSLALDREGSFLFTDACGTLYRVNPCSTDTNLEVVAQNCPDQTEFEETLQTKDQHEFEQALVDRLAAAVTGNKEARMKAIHELYALGMDLLFTRPDKDGSWGLVRLLNKSHNNRETLQVSGVELPRDVLLLIARHMNADPIHRYRVLLIRQCIRYLKDHNPRMDWVAPWNRGLWPVPH